jgi:hypothetical protein
VQTEDRERVNKKTGKVTVVRDSTPIKKGVVVVKEDTAMKQLQRFCDVCKVRWGITPLQIFIYRDEGHYEMPDDETSWKPNYHTHIVWDRMNHNTGKSCKLLPQDMSEMQTIWAEALGMERGTSKVQTGREHLERTDYIIAKQKQEAEKTRIAKEQAEKWSASDLREKAIAMIGEREYLRRKIAKGYNLWKLDKELLDEILRK